jgi:hypothetical protein
MHSEFWCGVFLKLHLNEPEGEVNILLRLFLERWVLRKRRGRN